MQKIVSLAAAVLCSLPAWAQPAPTPIISPVVSAIPAPPTVAARSYILMDAASGQVLAEGNADERVPPASLTKLMTSYVLSYELEQGRVKNEDMVSISEGAWTQNPAFKGSSLMFIQVGTQVSVHDLHMGIVVSSGNDASVAIAEYLAGGEDAFADVMNQHAQRLKMTNTHFVNSHGLPDPEHYTTARDLALLSKAIIEFPDEYAMYKVREFTYNGIRQYNRNGLLRRDPTVDGLKTGHTEEAGYCLVSSAKRNDMRLITVVMGADSVAIRERETEKLLSYGFRYFETTPLYAAGAEVSRSKVWYGDTDSVGVGPEAALNLTIPRGRRDALEATMNIDQHLKAPLEAGQVVGEMQISLDGKVLVKTPLVALQAVEKGGIFSRLWDALTLFFVNLLS